MSEGAKLVGANEAATRGLIRMVLGTHCAKGWLSTAYSLIIDSPDRSRSSMAKKGGGLQIHRMCLSLGCFGDGHLVICYKREAAARPPGAGAGAWC
jgi:hypothetical protein